MIGHSFSHWLVFHDYDLWLLANEVRLFGVDIIE